MTTYLICLLACLTSWGIMLLIARQWRPSHVPCGYCGKRMEADAVRQHVLSCPDNPLVREVEELKRQLETHL